MAPEIKGESLENEPLPATGTDYPAMLAITGADIISESRPAQAHTLAGEIMEKPDFQTWKLAGKVAFAGILDKADGVLARWGAKRLGIETTPEGAQKDQAKDKRWTYIMLGALAARALKDGDTEYGALLLASQAVIRTRDQKVNEKRKEAESLHVDAKAQGPGKLKTFMQNLTFTFMTSPLAKSEKGKKVAAYMQAASTGLSIYSGRSLIKSLNKEISVKKRFEKLRESYAAK